jgi:hypothetical protein
MIGCGVGLMFRASAAGSGRVLVPYLVLWMLLKVPALVAAPDYGGHVAGGSARSSCSWPVALLWAVADANARKWKLSGIADEAGQARARVAFGLALLPVGRGLHADRPWGLDGILHLLGHWRRRLGGCRK